MKEFFELLIMGFFSCVGLFVVYLMITVAFALYKDIWKKKEPKEFK